MTLERYLEPASIAEASRLAAADPWGAKLIAGGTALALMMRQGLVMPDTLISLQRVEDAGFRSVALEEGELRIGGGVVLTDVAAHPAVGEHAPTLAYACSVVGNTRVRNVATLGGNLAEADYASDPPAVLVSLGASVEITGPAGHRRDSVAQLITGFFQTSLEDGEVITAIRVPRQTGRAATYLKFRTRSSEDRPCVGIAAAARRSDGVLQDLEVVVGAVAAVPQRDGDLGQQTAGQRLDDDLIHEVARKYVGRIEPLDDARGSAWYRSRMIDVLVRRALRELVDEEPR